MQTWRLIYRSLFFLALTGGLLPVYLLCRAWFKPQHRNIARLWHRGVIRLIGLDVRLKGTALTTGPVLYVANHVSYLDIPILASQIKTTFVAKSEVRHWPLFGYLAHIADTVFIERRTARAPEQMRDLRSRLGKEDQIILFPEGTSTDGLKIENFKPVLFQSALPIRRQVKDAPVSKPVMVQPLSIAFKQGKEGRKRLPSAYAWFGEMTLLPHLMDVFRSVGGTVEITFHPPLNAYEIGDRKILATLSEKAVADGLEKSLLKFETTPPLRKETTLYSIDGTFPINDDAAALVDIPGAEAVYQHQRAV